jgi:hypothetical protein
MDGGIISAGIFLVILFQLNFLLLACYLFMGYLYLTMGTPSPDPRFDETLDTDSTTTQSTAPFGDLPPPPTIRMMLMFCYLIMSFLAIHSHFYLREVSRIFSFFLLLSVVINGGLYLFTRLAGSDRDRTDLRTSVE